MYKVYNKKDKVIMTAKTYEAALQGLRTGSYKCGEYLIVSPAGEAKKIIRYR